MLLALIRSKTIVRLPSAVKPCLKTVAKSVLPQTTQWLRTPVNSSNLLRVFRLTGLSLGFSAPLLKIAQCNIASGNVTRRSDHLISQYRTQTDYSLTFGEIWRLLKPYLGWVLGAVLSAILVAAVNIQLPITLGSLVNVIAGYIAMEAAEELSLSELKPVAFQLIGLYAAQAVLTTAYIYFLSVLGERMAADLRLQLFDRLLHQDMSFYDAQRIGELNARLSNDVQEFKSCFKMAVSQGLRTMAQTGGCIGSLLMISPKMTTLTVLVLPVVIGIGSIWGAVLRKLSKHAQAQSAVASAVSDEAFSNIRTVKAFAMEDSEIALYRREVDKTKTLNEQLGFWIGLFQGASNFVLNGVVLSVLYGGSFLIVNNEMTPGGLMSFLVTAQTIQKSLSQLSVVFGYAVKGRAAGARVFEFINLTPSVSSVDGGHRIPFHSLWGEIRFNDVSFSYPTRPGHVVFENLNIVFEPGRITALVGPSGEGKSTIAAMIERFYEPTSGSITLDGKDIRSLDLQWLRRYTIGIISQEPVLFGTTIAENIRYGKINATDEEVREAAKLANADDFITNFPQGYGTVVGERGVTLSGGQKQRIAIARALLKNPPILILDEATSALDSESERVVKEALDNAMRGRTVIVIAHRLSTVRNADEIVIVKGKKVQERGKHADLMKLKGVYYDLVNSQSELLYFYSTMGKKGGNRNKQKEGYDKPIKPRGEAGRVHNENSDQSEADSDVASEVTHLTLDDDMTSVLGDEGVDVEEDGELGDSPRDRLEEFLDNAAHKNCAIRTAAVKNIQVLLTKYYMYETLDKWKVSLIELIEKNIKKSEVETVLLSTLAALLSIQMGNEIGTGLDQILATMRQLCADPSQPDNVRCNCALALGVCVYLSSEQPTQVQDTLQTLNNVWTSVKVSSGSSNLFNAAIGSWALIADRSANVRTIINDYSKVVNYLDAGSLEMRVSAGETLGCVYEIALSNIDEEFTFPNHDFVVQKLSELATDSVKYRAKRDRRIQRFTFRQIHDFLRGGDAPSVSVKFGTEVLELSSLQEKLLYDMCCKFLHGGMNSHLKSNELIRDVFDLGAVREDGEPNHKLSKLERQIAQRDINRTRNMHRAKQRDKRSSHAF